MGRFKLPALASITALVLAPAPLALLVTATPALAQNATNCLSLDDGSLVNSCSFAIEASWCVENVDCRDGHFTNMATIGANSSYPVNGGRSGNYVHWAACRGGNTIHGADNYTFTCDE